MPHTIHTLASNVACAVAATATSTLHVGPHVVDDEPPPWTPSRLDIPALAPVVEQLAGT
ncbi:MAG TPA: hypothetical protein VIM10_13905 [Actinopolymorphaceae bacterium]